MTIVEVLFAILITTVGLFGAIAIFPFASAQARRARLYDMMAAAGRSSFHDFDARGMRRPDMWLAWDNHPNPAITGFQPALTVSNRQNLESYCIDPRMIAAHTGNPATSPERVQYFPFPEPFADADRNGFQIPGDAITDLNNDGTHDPPQFGPPIPVNANGRSFDTSLMRRITLRASANPSLASYNSPMPLAQANAIFQIDDDLSYERPDDDKSLPASQSAVGLDPTLPVGPTNTWGRRQADGKISWLATLVPKFDISGLASDEYVLSIVMIHERPADLDRLDHLRERVVFGQWQIPPITAGSGATPGVTGGEIRLEVGPSSESQEQLKLRPGDWVMVSGTYAVAGQFVTRFQWYRVGDCDNEPTVLPNGNHELYATLMGQDWNMNFVSPPSPPFAALVGQVRVTIVQGAFAVYEKTVRLDYGSTF